MHAMHHNISPHVYVAATLSTALAFFALFMQWGYQPEYFYAPILTLAVVYGLINLLHQHRGLSEFRIDSRPDFAKLLQRALARYLVWLPIFYIAAHAYRMVPYYNSMGAQPTLRFFDAMLNLYLAGGLPYFLLTLTFKSSRVEDFYDPAVRIIHIVKQTVYRTFLSDGRHSLLPVFKKRYNRKVLLNLAMRAYFIPIMVHQVYTHLDQSVTFAAFRFNDYSFFTITLWLIAFLWLCDVINASVAYTIESRWLENRTRSIDLSITGWVVCLLCYYPLNGITGSLFPFAFLVVDSHINSLVVPELGFFYAVKLLEVSLLALHIYIDVSLGTSVANISLKKLQTTGPYGVVRHPGTTTKLVFWFLISACYSAFWSWPIILGQLAWSTLYVARALTEERHLRQHEEYRAYMGKVRYRFIPGLI
jgi:protein-S-isoprenylcysteine O-methyltransferase Ste14